MYDHILVPIDLSSPRDNDKAFQTAMQMAKDYEATLHVMSVVPALDALSAGFFPKDFVQEATKVALAKLHDYTGDMHVEGVKLQHIVCHGAVYDQILGIAGKIQADLIVMASQGPELRDYLLGPNAARVVRHADCSVMVVRGGKTP